jgi:type IV pilus assembly protein PilE
MRGRAEPICRGFTILELMIVVAIVGVLAAIAYPGYVEYTKKTRRAETAAVLQEAAQAVERHFSRTGSYSGAIVPDRSPVAGRAAYDVRLAEGSATDGGYIITASAVSGGIMAGDDCATMTINALGQTTPADNKCWRQ